MNPTPVGPALAAAATEAELRTDLVVAHKLTAYYGMDELVWNHISARIPGEAGRGPAGVYLITPGDRHYLDIGPADLAVVGRPENTLANVTADVIHSAIFAARPDVGAIVHTHAPAATAVACLDAGLGMHDQATGVIYNKIAYYDWQGTSSDFDEQRDIAAAVTGSASGCKALMMRNHGVCTFGAATSTSGKTVGEAWVRMYYLERSSRLHLELLQTGAKIRQPREELLQHNARICEDKFPPGSTEWAPLKRWVLGDAAAGSSRPGPGVDVGMGPQGRPPLAKL